MVQLCLTFCDPKYYSLPGSPVHVILQARILEWVAIPFSRRSSWLGDQTCLSCIAGTFFYRMSPQGSPRIAEGVAIPFSRWFSPPWDWMGVFCVAGRFFTIWVPGKPKVKALVTQLCPTFCNQMDYSLPGPSVHGILQARILEWVVIPFSRGSSQPRDQTPIYFCSRNQI